MVVEVAQASPAMLDQAVRRCYLLNQLAISPLVSVGDGAGAKPAVRVYQAPIVPMAPERNALTETRVSSDRPNDPNVSPEFAGLRASLHRDGVRPDSSPAERADLPPTAAVAEAQPATDGSGSTTLDAPVSFQLLIASTGRWLWVEALAEGLVRQEQLQLIQAMGRVLDGPGVSIQHLQFDWPMVNHPHLPKDINAARQSVAGQLQRLAKDASATGIILLGTATLPFVSEALNLLRLAVPGTVDMLAKPEMKRQTWSVLKPHVSAR